MSEKKKKFSPLLIKKKTKQKKPYINTSHI